MSLCSLLYNLLTVESMVNQFHHYVGQIIPSFINLDNGMD